MTVQIKGLAQAQKEFQKRIGKLTGVTPKAITDVALDLLGESVRRAPVLTGDLRGSGLAKVNGANVAKGNKDGGIDMSGKAAPSARVNAEVGFYGLPYTVRQHEDTTLNHPQGGEAKFLETSFKERTGKYIKHMRDSVKGAVE